MRFCGKMTFSRNLKEVQGESHAGIWRKTVLSREKGKNTCPEHMLLACFRDSKDREGTSVDNDNNCLTELL